MTKKQSKRVEAILKKIKSDVTNKQKEAIKKIINEYKEKRK